MVAWAPLEFMTSRDIGQEKCLVKPLKLKKVNIQLFKEHFFFQNRQHKTGDKATELPLSQLNSKEYTKKSEEFWGVSQIGEF